MTLWEHIFSLLSKYTTYNALQYGLSLIIFITNSHNNTKYALQVFKIFNYCYLFFVNFIADFYLQLDAEIEIVIFYTSY